MHLITRKWTYNIRLRKAKKEQTSTTFFQQYPYIKQSVVAAFPPDAREIVELSVYILQQPIPLSNARESLPSKGLMGQRARSYAAFLWTCFFAPALLLLWCLSLEARRKSSRRAARALSTGQADTFRPHRRWLRFFLSHSRRVSFCFQLFLSRVYFAWSARSRNRATPRGAKLCALWDLVRVSLREQSPRIDRERKRKTTDGKMNLRWTQMKESRVLRTYALFCADGGCRSAAPLSLYASWVDESRDSDTYRIYYTLYGFFFVYNFNLGWKYSRVVLLIHLIAQYIFFDDAL